MPDLILVACAAAKLPERAAAKDLYTASLWFRKARAYAERQGAPWRILSARHGLVDPEQILEPYNETLGGQEPQSRRAWADRVARALCVQFPSSRVRVVELLAGRAYREFLQGQLEQAGYQVVLPLEHLGIGRQMQWLTGQVAI